MPLKLNNLSKKFGEKSIFDNFSYEFEESGIYVIRGESGIGKTTLLRLISGLDDDYSGVIENGGVKNISFMFQEYRLFPALSALENASISVGKKYSDDAYQMLIKLGFEENDMRKKTRELSGGMKQRVAFVRALLKTSPILILDEPTKELDTNTAEIMLDMIKEAAKSRLIILVTHDDVSAKFENPHIISL
jgi:ABC-type multidrug transport system ATPase subunit